MRCKISKKKIESYQKLHPKVHANGKFISSRTKTGRKIIKKLICYKRAK